VQLSLSFADLHLFGYMSTTGRAGSYGSSNFSFLMNLHTDFHSGWTNLHSYQQRIRIPFPLPHPHQYLFLFVFMMIAIPSGVRWNLSVVLICISLWLRILNIFHVFIGHLYTSSFPFIGPLISWIICSFGV
jgi:hypothetical protein